MKKTYIKPETTVVALNVRDNVLMDPSRLESGGQAENDGEHGESREVIRSRGAWEEW